MKKGGLDQLQRGVLSLAALTNTPGQAAGGGGAAMIEQQPSLFLLLAACVSLRPGWLAVMREFVF